MIPFFRSATTLISLFCAAGLLASCTTASTRKPRVDNVTTTAKTTQAATTATENHNLKRPDQRHLSTQEQVEQLQNDQLRAFTEKCAYSTPTTKATKPQRAATNESSPAQKNTTEYTVQTGENLYAIAARANIYHEGLLWPLIYKSNRDQIKDPQQIFPGQTLTITRNHTEDEKEQARETARNSGIFKQQHEDEQTTPLST